MSDRRFSRPYSSASSTLVLCIAMSLLAGGCIDWSGDVDVYRKVLNDKPSAAPPPYDPEAPLPLVSALRLAEADNEAIASRGEDYIQALAQKLRAAGTFLPTVTIGPTYTLSNYGASGKTSFGGGSGTSHQFTVPLDASATGSLSNVSNYQSAGRTAEQRALLLLDQRETTLLLVISSYYGALRAEHQERVYEKSLTFKAEKVRDQTTRLRLGNVRPLDLAQTQADLAATRVSLTQARTDAYNSRSALARLIGQPAVRGPLSDAFDPPASAPELDAWQHRAAMSRQDLLAADRNVEAARLSLEASIREYFPTVTVNFSYFLYNDPASVQNWSNVLSASIPIFSALSIEADIRRAWSGYRQAGLARSQNRRQVIDDVNESFRTLRDSDQKIADLKVEVEAAERAFELSERAYQLGSISNIDRLLQQDNLLTAQLNLVSEQYNNKQDYLTLLRASGLLATMLRDANGPTTAPAASQ